MKCQRFQGWSWKIGPAVKVVRPLSGVICNDEATLDLGKIGFATGTVAGPFHSDGSFDVIRTDLNFHF